MIIKEKKHPSDYICLEANWKFENNINKFQVWIYSIFINFYLHWLRHFEFNFNFYTLINLSLSYITEFYVFLFQ